MSIEDRLAILETIALYAHAWDDRDADTYADCFTEDGVFEDYIRSQSEPITRLESRAAIHEWARGIHAGYPSGIRTRHMPLNTVFDELTLDRARTRTMLFDTLLRPGDSAPWLANTGVYIDQWRRTSDGWRLARREVHHDRSHTARARDAVPPR